MVNQVIKVKVINDLNAPASSAKSRSSMKTKAGLK